MSGESIIIGCLVLFGIYGIFKYTKSSETDQSKMLAVVMDIRSDITALSRRIKSLEVEQSTVNANFKNYRKLVEDLAKDVDGAQDHLSKMRKTSQFLEKQTYPQKIELDFKPIGPIPIEIYTRVPKQKTVERKVLTKTKTGFRSRVETRHSPLKGDPDKYSWPKLKSKENNPKGR